MPAVLPLIGVALSAAGAGYGIDSSINATNQMNQDTANEVSQLQGLQKKATPLYQANLTSATKSPVPQQASAQALQQYQQLQTPAGASAPGVNAPPSKAVDARGAADIARGQQAQAAEAQYPAQVANWNVGNTTTGAQLGNLASIGSSIASTLPATLSLDQTQGQIGQSIGAGIGSLGTLAGAYGTSQSTNDSNAALLAAIKGSLATKSNTPDFPTNSGSAPGTPFE